MTLRLTKRDNGIWQVSGTHNGVKIGRTSLGIRNKREAEVELAKRMQAGEFGRANHEYTVGEARDIWLKERGPQCSEQSIKKVEMVTGHFEKMKIKDVDDRAVIDYLATLTGVKGGGRRTYISMLRTVLRLGCKRLKISPPPVDWADIMPPKSPARQLTYTEEERDRILKAAYKYAASPFTLGGDKLWGHYVLTLMRTGARPGELCDAKWTDLHDDHITLYSKKGKGKVLKGRAVPLAEEVVQALNEIDRSSDYIFGGLSYDGRKMIVGSLKASFQRILKLAGLPGHAYILRHTFGTYVARETGGNPAVVQALMGHSDVGTTMNYIKPLADDMRQAVDAYSKKGDE